MPTDADIPSVYITGAQCTGKSTLVRELKVAFHGISQQLEIDEPALISEVARTVLAEHPIATEDIRASPSRSLELQTLILDAQVAVERNALCQSSWFISDRSGIDPIVYARRYTGQESSAMMMESAAWLESRSRMEQSLIVVCEAGVDWLEDDGVRLMPQSLDDWMEFHHLFCSILNEAGLYFFVIPRGMKSITERVQLVLSKWQLLVDERLGRKEEDKNLLRNGLNYT
jgi:predicted ATPase